MNKKEPKRIKLSQFARDNGIAYGTAYKHWNEGRLEGIKLSTGTILVEGWKVGQGEEPHTVVVANYSEPSALQVILYARTKKSLSMSQVEKDLEEQLVKLRAHASEQGYEIVEELREVALGLDPYRPVFKGAMYRTDWDILLVVEKEKAVKFGFDYIHAALAASNRRIEALNPSVSNIENAENVLLELVKTLNSLLGNLFGISGAKNTIKAQLNRILD